MLIRSLSSLLLLTAAVAGQDPFARARLTEADRANAEQILGAGVDEVLGSIGAADVAVRREAGRRLQLLERAQQARLVRAALWSEDPVVAFGAAVAAPVEWLDVAESARARGLLEPRVFTKGTAVDFPMFADLLGAADVARLLADPAPLPREHPKYVELLHRPMRPEHIPLLARLMLSDDALVRAGSLNAMRVVAELTDRYRENVAAALLSWPGGVPMRLRFDPARDRDPVEPRDFALPEPTGGFPPLLEATLRRILVMRAGPGLMQYQAWLRRWAMTARAAEGDLPLLRALARRDATARAIAARSAADLGAREVLGALVDDDLPRVRALALCGLARAAEADAIAELESSGLADSLRLAAWLEADPAAALDAVAKELAAGGEAARVAVTRVADAVDVAHDVPFRIDVDPGAALAASAVAAEVPPSVLAALAGALPGARTRALADAWLERLDPASLSSPAIDLLEVAGRDAFVAKLRELAAAGEPAALDVLLALGDPESAALLVAQVGAVEAEECAEVHATEVSLFIRLARSGSPAVEAFLLDVLSQEPRGYRALAALAALDACRGTDEHLARSLLGDLYEYEDRAREEWDSLAAAAREGSGGAVVLAWLADRDLGDGPLDGLGTLEASAARAWLGRALTEREHGLLWWAIGELAPNGDPAALDQLGWAVDAGWYRRIDDADPRALTNGLELRLAPRWISALGTNCCAAVPAGEALGALFGDGFGDRLHDDLAETPVERARAFHDRYGARLRWSRISGHFVVGPER